MKEGMEMKRSDFQTELQLVSMLGSGSWRPEQPEQELQLNKSNHKWPQILFFHHIIANKEDIRNNRKEKQCVSDVRL